MPRLGLCCGIHFIAIAPTTAKGGDQVTVTWTVKNVGTGPAAELATFIVEKGKPLITLAD